MHVLGKHSALITAEIMTIILLLNTPPENKLVTITCINIIMAEG